MIIKLVSLSIISFLTSSLATKLFNNPSNKKPPIIPDEMQEILNNNNYIPLEEWRNNNKE